MLKYLFEVVALNIKANKKELYIFLVKFHQMRFRETVVKVPEACPVIINQSHINTSTPEHAEKSFFDVRVSRLCF